MLFGGVTVSCFCLPLTDNDPAEHDPFDSYIRTDKCYKDCVTQLCVFNGLLIKFQEQIYPLLPKKPCKKEENTSQERSPNKTCPPPVVYALR